jgi:hypothetical protein
MMSYGKNDKNPNAIISNLKFWRISMTTSTVHKPLASTGVVTIKRQNQRLLHILKYILYVLASLILALGLVAGISLIASSANIQNILLPFQLMGAEAIANLITPYLRGLISGLGVVALILSLVLSTLLIAVGRLIGHIAALETRLALLEEYTEPSL